jgi:hypothetical protein
VQRESGCACASCGIGCDGSPARGNGGNGEGEEGDDVEVPRTWLEWIAELKNAGVVCSVCANKSRGSSLN